ncbi:MAG: glutathione-disulfide reductase, partial [Elainellaceae cyanobacterium]
MSYDFDLFVIGAGSGGIATARRAAEYGAKVAVAEFGRLGGTCVNRGCVPKKLMVYSSHFPDYFKAAEGYGWSPVSSSFDWKALTTAVNNETARLNGIYQRMLDKSNVEIFPHHARFVDEHTLEVGDQKVTADKILIAVGGKPVLPDIPGIEHAITSDDIFHVEEHPKRVVILGGGYIGCEFASILNGLGIEVTQIIRGDKILRGFDDDIRTEIQEAMQKHGVRLLTHTNIVSITKTDGGVEVKLKTDAGEEIVVADAVNLSATGREPLLDNLGLENTGVELNGKAIAVDEYSQTAVENIYSVGDCTSKIELTPVAINEGRALADTQFGGKSRTMSYENIPTAVFTTPEAATVGLTEAEAVEQYGESNIKVYRSRFRPMYYTLPNMDAKTLMKLIVHQESGKVVGAHMVGDGAAEIIQGVAIAVKMGATKADFDATVGIHPS